MARESKRVKIGDGGQTTVTVYELTVAEMRQWLKDQDRAITDEEDFDALGAALYQEISFDDFYRLTDLKAQDMDALTQSDLNVVRRAMKDANPDFFDMRARLMQRMEDLKQQAPASNSSSTTAPSSPGSATATS